MIYDPRVIQKFARAHFAAVSFISTACGLIAGSVLGVYGSRIGFHSAPQPTVEMFKLMESSISQASGYACAGFLAAWIPGFIIGKIVGFFVSYPIKVNAQLLLLAMNVEENLKRPSGMPGVSGGSVLEFKRSA